MEKSWRRVLCPFLAFTDGKKLILFILFKIGHSNSVFGVWISISELSEVPVTVSQRNYRNLQFVNLSKGFKSLGVLSQYAESGKFLDQTIISWNLRDFLGRMLL
jgi:hypothetical protein